MSDYERILEMKSTILTKIEFEEKKVDSKFKTVGLQIYFKGEEDPIIFGSKGERQSTASFDESRPI